MPQEKVPATVSPPDTAHMPAPSAVTIPPSSPAPTTPAPASAAAPPAPTPPVASPPAATTTRRRPNLPRSSLPVVSSGIQVNFCKNPQCANFGVPVPLRKTPGVKGTYKLIGGGTQTGTVHVRCVPCGEKIPMKSNAGIVEELERLQAPLRARKPISCPHAACANHAVAVETPGAYRAYGYNSAGSPRWRCKACGRVFSKSLQPTGRQEKSSKNRLLFKTLVGKVPLRRVADIVEVDAHTVRRRVEFIHERCVAFAADREARLAEMEMPRLYLSIDGQEQIINWRDKKDRRNVVLSAITSVDNDTGYCFGIHLNFDPTLDRRIVEADAAAVLDIGKPVALRKYARLWLEDDYEQVSADKAARKRRKASQPGGAGGPAFAASGPTGPSVTLGAPVAGMAAALAAGVAASGVFDDVDAAYAAQQEREDIENPDEPGWPRALPDRGMQTRRDYTMAAHFAYLRRLCPKVGKWRLFLDQDPGMRAAALSGFIQEIQAGTCDAWFVRVNKTLTIDKRRKLRREAKLRYEAILAANPGFSSKEVVREMIKIAHAAMTPHGNWNDRWLAHPYPNMGEPEKAICWLTERAGMTPDHVAALYNKASLHGVDSFFNQLRRRSSMLERPIATASNSGRVWSAYSAYNPTQTMRMLEIVRVCHNFVWPSDLDKKTPAMRLGLARAPIDYAVILDFPW